LELSNYSFIITKTAKELKNLEITAFQLHNVTNRKTAETKITFHCF